MSETRIRIRANRTTGELEVEGPAAAVAEWWEKLWPDLGQQAAAVAGHQGGKHVLASLPVPGARQLPDLFGEFYAEFRSDITDVDKVLVAGAFVQGKNQERVFTTKAANEALLDQNIKVSNASENVRRLMQSKRVFVVSEGKYRVSAGGLERLNSLRANA